MKKVILPILILLLLCGCSLTVDVDISKDYSVKENITISDYIDNIDITNSSYEDYINDFKEFSIENYDLKNYTYDSLVKEDIVGGSAFKEYNKICNYSKNSSFAHGFFNTFNCTEKSDYYYIEATTNYFKCGDDCDERADIDYLTINFTIMPKVIESNANRIEGNKYTWVFSETSDNVLKLKIKKSKINNIINKTSIEKASVNMIFVIIVIILIIVVISLLFYNKYKKNKLDY